jgi:heme-degrading monooxygenase HmoA
LHTRTFAHRNMIAQTPPTPYYAVIFTSLRTPDETGYAAMADAMEKLAAQQEGYLGIEFARNEIGITVSYWQSLEAIRNWKANADHLMAQKYGREKWYESYKVRICKVERDHGFEI